MQTTTVIKLKELLRLTTRGFLLKNAQNCRSTQSCFRLNDDFLIYSKLNKNVFTKNLQRCYLSTRPDNLAIENEITLEFKNGLTKLFIILPAKNEKCEFNLRLINDTVGNLIEQIKNEDKSIEKVLFYSHDGVRISKDTPIGLLLTQPFRIKINENLYAVELPQSLVNKSESTTSVEIDSKQQLEQIKELVSKLYLHLNIEQFEIEREQEILKKLEQLKSEIEPMERVKEELALKAKKHTNRMIWLGLGMMCVQAGIMARLTWFDYSWDIVEPISYFVSYSAVIGVYAYYVLTRKEYAYESASDRIFLRHFHKNALKQNLNVDRYNQIKSSIYYLENDLKKIKDSHLKNYEKTV